MLRPVLIAALTLLLATPAAAVERPRLDVLGFSPDGRFFAYSQSGLDVDNSHFADLFVVETRTDKWVSGTPIRVRIPADASTPAQARALLDKQTARPLRRLGMSRPLAGIAYVPRDKHHMYLDLPWGERAMLTLTPQNGLAAPGCPMSIPVGSGATAGFHLTLQRPTEVSVLHNDRTIPRQRGCALSYRFASGFVKSRGSDAVIAALIAYREATATGDIRTRYMAITGVVQAPGGH